jgi:hypothetical protein
MLKTVSSITNAIGALNYKGTWNASTNSPALASGVGTKGDYYVVSVAGATALDGISNWGIGDLATFNGSVWQRVEGGADLNGVNLSVSGTSTLSGLTASTALALDASKNVVSVTNTGTGNNVLATAPTLVNDVTLSTGNLVIGTSGKGIQGTTTNNNAAAGVVGEYVSSTVAPASLIALTSPTAADITSISLTAGDWDVAGIVGFGGISGTSVVALVGANAGSSSGGIGPSIGIQVLMNDSTQISTVADMTAALPVYRYSLAATTTMYLVVRAIYTTGSIGAYGTISARRVR